MFKNQFAIFIQRSQNSEKEPTIVFHPLTMMLEKPNHQPYLNQEAEKYKEVFNSTSNTSVTVVIAQQYIKHYSSK